MAERRPPSEEGTIGLLLDTIGGVLRLWRGEMALVKAEARRASRQAAIAAVQLLVALVFVFLGLNLIVASAVAGLVWLGLAQPWATLLAGVILLAIAALLVWLAVVLLRRAACFPARQMRNLKRDVVVLASAGDRDET